MNRVSEQIMVTIGNSTFPVATVQANCRHCMKSFLAKERERRRNRGKFCSVGCALKGRQLNQRGPHNSHAKLTWVKVLEIRRERAAGHSLAIIAADYGVREATIWAICSGKTWKIQ